jgi:hypothetical protein
MYLKYVLELTDLRPLSWRFNDWRADTGGGEAWLMSRISH